MYKLKQERSFKIFRHNHATTNVDNIRKAIEDQAYTVTNIKALVRPFPCSMSSYKPRAIIRISMRLDHFFIAK